MTLSNHTVLQRLGKADADAPLHVNTINHHFDPTPHMPICFAVRGNSGSVRALLLVLLLSLFAYKQRAAGCLPCGDAR